MESRQHRLIAQLWLLRHLWWRMFSILDSEVDRWVHRNTLSLTSLLEVETAHPVIHEAHAGFDVFLDVPWWILWDAHTFYLSRPSYWFNWLDRLPCFPRCVLITRKRCTMSFSLSLSLFSWVGEPWQLNT
jgi:hypothetical protein